MPARITCPHCQQELRLPDHLYDGPAQCPRCAGAFAIEWTPRSHYEMRPTERGDPGINRVSTDPGRVNPR
jgi:hypothetical protein